MKSVGEVMAIGRTFKEALGKAWRGMETNGFDLGESPDGPWAAAGEEMLEALAVPAEGRLHLVERALLIGHTVDDVAAASGIDPWFVDQIAEVVEEASAVHGRALSSLAASDVWQAKRAGLSDSRLALLTGATEAAVRAPRRRGHRAGVQDGRHVRGRVSGAHALSLLDLRGGDRGRTGVAPSHRDPRRRAEPHRAGHRVRLRLRPCGLRPRGSRLRVGRRELPSETVSTDYDTSSRLYFEPLSRGCAGRVPCRTARRGDRAARGQTPLRLAGVLAEEGFPVLGTSPEAIDRAEDRGKFARVLAEARDRRPAARRGRTIEEARAVARRVGYPVVVRPSYVLGGRAMEIVYDDDELETFARTAADTSPDHPGVDRPVPRGRDRGRCRRGGRPRRRLRRGRDGAHRGSGVHSGDSSCQIPPATLGDRELDGIEDITRRLARRLGVVGLLNLQLAVKDERIWVLEANPRASRTVPFVSKATGVSLARVATLVLTGRTLADLVEPGVLSSRSSSPRDDCRTRA